MLQVIGGDEARRSEMTTKRLAELDERDHQLEQRLAELRDELAAVQREPVSAAAIQRAVALFDPVWTCSSSPNASAFCICSSSGATGELEMGFYQLGITSLAAEAATIWAAGLAKLTPACLAVGPWNSSAASRSAGRQGA